MYADFRAQLASLADDKYRLFCMRGIPCDRPFLGVRIPEIRQLVQSIPPAAFTDFLSAHPVAFEEVIARGFLIVRLPYPQMLHHFQSQITLLDNWCAVDTFCAALRHIIKPHLPSFLTNQIEPLLQSQNEFAVRTGLVCLLNSYVTSDYLQLIFDRVSSLQNRSEYYIKMALAWLLAECFIKFPDETYFYLQQATLDQWILRKAISKICDSRRVCSEAKRTIKQLRSV